MSILRNPKSIGRRILFAEDHQPTRDVLALLLRKAGYSVDTAPNGAAAFHRFEASPSAYDVIITDHDMPELDGVGLVRKLREAQFPGRIFVLSGGSTFANATTYADLHVDQILSKPISSHALIERIQSKRNSHVKSLHRGDH
jgi:DNA-binding response OmpR family regulator